MTRKLIVAILAAGALLVAPLQGGPHAAADPDQPPGGGSEDIKWKSTKIRTTYKSPDHPNGAWQTCRLSLSRPFADGSHPKRLIRARYVLRCPHKTVGAQGCLRLFGDGVANQTCGYIGVFRPWRWSEKLKRYKFVVERGVKFSNRHQYLASASICTKCDSIGDDVKAYLETRKKWRVG
jgi:hypothetical protein